MLYQPSYPYPYLSDIDASVSNTFRCLINAEGGTTVNGYNLRINDLNGTQVYTTTKQTLTTPLYGGEVLNIVIPNSSTMQNGLDYVWNVTLYESLASIWVTYGTIQATSTTTSIYLRKSPLIKTGMILKINNQSREITEWNDETGVATVTQAFTTAPNINDSYNIYTNNVTSNDIFFQARTTPTLTINTIPSTIANKSYTFSAVYSQTENIDWKYFEWTFYNAQGVVIDTSGQINSGIIEYTFDGFIDGQTYGVSIFLENQDGYELETEIQYFNVDYAQPSLVTIPAVTNACGKNALQVKWSALLINQGVSEGIGTEPYYTLVPNEPYIGGSSVEINPNADIYWYIGSSNNFVDLPFESTTYINWTTEDRSFNDSIFRLDGEYVNLLSISASAPSTCVSNDKYYNTVTGLIYTAIATNTWASTGEIPSDSNLYYNLSNDNVYEYNDTTLVQTDKTLPYYDVSYNQGTFYYTISNGEQFIQGSVPIFDVQERWLLQPLGVSESDAYIWTDNLNWTDNLFWMETSVSPMTQYWFKITMLPTGIQVQILEKI